MSKEQHSKASEYAPNFLGAYAENNDIFESILLEFYRDHVFWRRGFHPEDAPPIGPSEQFQPAFLEAVGQTKRELHKLSGKLKQSVPFFHPRYIGHMSSDLLMPGLLAQMITTLYNPNNVSTEAAPVTVDMEVEYGQMLACMFGYNTDPTKGNTAFGHLTSGGTVANYQGLWYARAVKYYPLAVKAGTQNHDRIKLTVSGQPLQELSCWQLANVPYDDIIQLRRDLMLQLNSFNDEERQLVLNAVEEQRIESLGLSEFFKQHPTLSTPIVIVPSTAHYSWKKSGKIFGLGSKQIVKVPTDHKMRMDTRALKETLDSCLQNNTPVLAVIGVLGTTEFGTIDPIREMLEIREKYTQRGLNFFIHVDAAWGGFLATLFRDEDNKLIPRQRLKSEFRHFPSQEVYDTFSNLHHVESITVDPHKLGYLPFGCGAFVAKNTDAQHLVKESAAYVFDDDDADLELGQYIFEGSKPGAAAAAAYVTANVLPLNFAHFGKLPVQTIRTTEYFFDKIAELNQKHASEFEFVIPIEPDTNLICLAVKPKHHTCTSDINVLLNRVYEKLNIDIHQPLQVKSFFASSTKIFWSHLSENALTELSNRIGLAIDTDNKTEDHLFVLRHTIMNPWIATGEVNYIDKYLEYLDELVMSEL